MTWLGNGLPANATMAFTTDAYQYANVYVHAGLTVGSFAPSVLGSAFAVLDAGVYALEGDYTAAGIGIAAAVVGIFADAGLAKAAGALALKALPSPRAWLIRNATDPKLRNRIEALYRRNAKVGNGGTADALRYEIRTGELLSREGHAQKAIECGTV